MRHARLHRRGAAREHRRRLRAPRRRRRLWDCSTSCSPGERDHSGSRSAYYRKDGAAIWTDLVLSLIRDDDGSPRYVVAMVEDITERHLLQTRLQHQALHDPLTGLPNRTLFFDRLDAAARRRRADAPDRRLLPRPRRLQGRQRHASATTSATSCCRPSARRLAPSCVAGAATWSPGWAATSSWSWSTHGAGIDDAGRRRRDGAGHGPRPGRTSAATQISRLGQHRHRRARRSAATSAGRADEGRRHHAVLGEGRRARTAARSSTPSATPAESPATRCPPRMPAALDRRRVLRRVPAAGPAARRLDLIGVEALVRWRHPELAACSARTASSAGRGDRPDRAARPRGAATRRAGRPPQWQRADPRRAAADERQPGRPAGPRPRHRRRRGRRPRRDRAAARAAAAGAHRERGHGHRRGSAGGAATTWPTGRPASPSTTSAPATPTWPTCAACRSTASSWPARSSGSGRAGPDGADPGRADRGALVRAGARAGAEGDRRGGGDGGAGRRLRALGCDTGQGLWFGAPAPRRQIPPGCAARKGEEGMSLTDSQAVVSVVAALAIVAGLGRGGGARACRHCRCAGAACGVGAVRRRRAGPLGGARRRHRGRRRWHRGQVPSGRGAT